MSRMDVYLLSVADRREAAALIRVTAATSPSPAVAAWLHRLAADLTPIADDEFNRLLGEALK